MRQHSVLLLRSECIGWSEVGATFLAMPEVREVRQCATPNEARRLVASLRPDIVVAATTIAGVSVQPILAELLHQECVQYRAILLSTQFDPLELEYLDLSRVAAYLLWNDVTAETLHQCLVASISGG